MKDIRVTWFRIEDRLVCEILSEFSEQEMNRITKGLKEAFMDWRASPSARTPVLGPTVEFVVR